MKAAIQAFFYMVILFWVISLLKMILIYIRWNAETLFLVGCVLMTTGFMPMVLYSYRERYKKKMIWIILLPIGLSVLAYLAGTKSGFNNFFPNFWIAILLQALALGILSVVTAERRTILMIWMTWIVFSTVLMTMHLLDGTL
jgi:hypothetical protein